MAISGRYRHVVRWDDRDGTDRGTTRAHIRGTSAGESEIAGLDTGVVGVTLKIRTHPGTVHPGVGWTAHHGDRVLRVKGSYDPVGRGHELTVIAVEAT